jgi:hypothetical protein
MCFNDRAATSFEDVRALIPKARKAALKKLHRPAAPVPQIEATASWHGHTQNVR